MHRGQGAQRAKSKLSGLCKVQVAGNQHGFNVFQVHFASIRLKISGFIVSRQRAVGLQHNLGAVNLIPTWLEHGSGKNNAIGAVIRNSARVAL